MKGVHRDEFVREARCQGAKIKTNDVIALDDVTQNGSSVTITIDSVTRQEGAKAAASGGQETEHKALRKTKAALCRSW